MAKQNWEEEKPKVDLPYEEHRMPRALLLIWIVFLVWAVAYVGLYLVPDLSQWLKG